jgi:cytochrome c peroxidase
VGEKRALSDQQKRGSLLFFGKASCTQCHNGPNFTDNKYYSLGALPGDNGDSDVGRLQVSKHQADRCAFKIPSLRNVALHPPYMHNGSLMRLNEVIDWYDRGAGEGPKSDLLHKLDLTSSEKADLISFLEALSGKMPEVKRPDPISLR